MKINMIHNMVVFFHINSVVILQIQPKGSSNDSDIKKSCQPTLKYLPVQEAKGIYSFFRSPGIIGKLFISLVL